METVRSAWEHEIEAHLRKKYPNLEIVTNDRTIVPSRYSLQKLELDFFFPEISLAVELNGAEYHDKNRYYDDLAHGTEVSDEAYKERYCATKGIKLMHIWSSNYADSATIIDSEIDARLRNPNVKPYKKGLGKIDTEKAFYAVVCGAMVIAGLAMGFLAMGNSNPIEGLVGAGIMIWFATRLYKSV